MTYLDGRKYEGQFVLNKQSGEGIMSYPDGNTYAGQWRDDKPHGFGVLKIAESGEIQVGEFNKGNLAAQFSEEESQL